jgi:hypothetical protein
LSCIDSQIIQLRLYATHTQIQLVALSAYDGLLSLQPHWNNLLSRRGLDHVEDKNEFKDGVRALRALCLRSFPEFLADLKIGGDGKGIGYEYQVGEFHCLSRECYCFLCREILVDIFCIRLSKSSKRFHIFGLPLSLPSMHSAMEIGGYHSSIIKNILFVGHPYFRLLLLN